MAQVLTDSPTSSAQQLPLAGAVALLASSLVALASNVWAYLNDRSASEAFRSDSFVRLADAWDHNMIGRAIVGIGLASVFTAVGGYLVWRLWRSRARHDFGVALGLVAAVVLTLPMFAATYGVASMFFPR